MYYHAFSTKQNKKLSKNIWCNLYMITLNDISQRVFKLQSALPFSVVYLLPGPSLLHAQFWGITKETVFITTRLVSHTQIPLLFTSISLHYNILFSTCKDTFKMSTLSIKKQIFPFDSTISTSSPLDMSISTHSLFFSFYSWKQHTTYKRMITFP